MQFRMRMVIWVLLGGLLGFVAVAAALAFFPQGDEFLGTVFDPPAQAYEISLAQADGSVYRISDQAGKVVIMFFGYTHCPDVCPVTLNDFRIVEEILGEDASDVEMVMITVDPDRDSPEVIADYVERFSPSIVGLSGPEDELVEIWKGYFVYRAVQRADSPSPGDGGENPGGDVGYLVDHTSRVYVVDKDGNLRLSFPFATGAETIAADVRRLLRE